MSLVLTQTRCAERDTSPLPNRLDDDSNDGVRINIRPFAQAGILRKTPNIKWGKDRGKEPERDKDEYPWFNPPRGPNGERVNSELQVSARHQSRAGKLSGHWF